MGDKANEQGPSAVEASLSDKERQLWNSDFNKFVKHLFQKGHSREEVWNKCSALDDVEFLDNVSELIQSMDTNPFRDWLSQYFRDLASGCMCQFVIVMEMYERAKNEIDTFLQDDRFNYRLLNERYTLCFSYDDPGKCVYLIDNFHGQHKKFKIDGKASLEFENSYCFWSEIISPEYLLFVEEDPDEENLLISLVSLDLQKSKATLLQTKEICAIATNLVFDFNDRKKFAYLSMVDFLVYAVYVGRVENDQIIMSTDILHINCELFCPRLDGERLQGLIIKEDQSGIMESDDSEYQTLELKFGEFHLEQTGEKHLQFHKLFDVDIPYDMHIIHLPRKCHYVSSNLGYAIGKWMTTHHTNFGIFMIDMETHSLRLLKSLYYHNAESTGHTCR
ncbi:hypothetical protein M3Y97_00917700 [Aphelenchoides bicaudatus]|nr:hypothetical protein M3Y97_00917700 [Aphelenchoides bicaudatus]